MQRAQGMGAVLGFVLLSLLATRAHADKPDTPVLGWMSTFAGTGPLPVGRCVPLGYDSGVALQKLPKQVEAAASGASDGLDKGSRFEVTERRRVRLPFDKKPWYIACGALQDGFGRCQLYRPTRAGYSEEGASKFGRDPGGLLVELTSDGTALRFSWRRERDDSCCFHTRPIWTDVVSVARLGKGGATALGSVQFGYGRKLGKAGKTRLELCFGPDLKAGRRLQAIVALRDGVAVRAVAWDARRKTFRCADLRKSRVDLAARWVLAGQRVSEEMVANLAKLDYWLIRNAIYARHGLPFKSKRISGWFYGPKARYPGLKPDPAYSQKRLTRADWANARLLRSVETDATNVQTASDCAPATRKRPTKGASAYD